MAVAQKTETLSPQLLKVMQRAKRDPEVRFTSLAHLIDEAALIRAYQRLGKDAAVGLDGITKEQYRERLEDNVKDLHNRLKTMR